MSSLTANAEWREILANHQAESGATLQNDFTEYRAGEVHDGRGEERKIEEDGEDKEKIREKDEEMKGRGDEEICFYSKTKKKQKLKQRTALVGLQSSWQSARHAG